MRAALSAGISSTRCVATAPRPSAAAARTTAALSIDLGDAGTIRRALDASRPDVVFHLAAQTFVPDALASPVETYEINAVGSARLAEAVRAYDAGPPPRIVFASSAEVYGVRDAREYPLRETVEPRPQNPYGASKAAAEAILLGESRAFGLDVVIARAFNTIGPGQSERFVVASFAAQLARIAAGANPKLFVGNLEHGARFSRRPRRHRRLHRARARRRARRNL